jgi:uncharacterized protein YbjT (DUF2867 family)
VTNGADGAPFEVIERAGSYAAPIAAIYCRRIVRLENAAPITSGDRDSTAGALASRTQRQPRPATTRAQSPHSGRPAGSESPNPKEDQMIVITTPTGAIGHQVLDNVLNSREPIRVIVRDPSRLRSHVHEHVEVVPGSHGDPDVVDQAFAGADAVFWLVPPDPRAETVDAGYSGFTCPAAEAFRKHGVSRVVGVSALGRGLGVARHAGLVTASLAMDDLIASTGVNYRALTMPSFMDNLLRQAEAIKNQGLFFSPVSGDHKNPTCATRDIAAAAAGWLLDDSWTGVGHVALLGPEDLSFDDMAQIMSEVLGKPVRFQQIPGEAFKARLMERGTSEAMAQATLDMLLAKNNGLDNAEPRIPEAATPTSFRQWCQEVLKPAVDA